MQYLVRYEITTDAFAR